MKNDYLFKAALLVTVAASCQIFSGCSSKTTDQYVDATQEKTPVFSVAEKDTIRLIVDDPHFNYFKAMENYLLEQDRNPVDTLMLLQGLDGRLNSDYYNQQIQRIGSHEELEQVYGSSMDRGKTESFLKKIKHS